MQVRFCFSAVCDVFVFFFFFLFVNQISRERLDAICAKFTGKTCLINDSEEFEYQSQRSKVKVTRDRKRKTAESSSLTMHCNACAVRCKPRAAGDGTIASQPGVTG